MLLFSFSSRTQDYLLVIESLCVRSGGGIKCTELKSPVPMAIELLFCAVTVLLEYILPKLRGVLPLT